MSTPICPPPQPVRTGERSLPERMCGGPGTAKTADQVVGRRPPALYPLPDVIVSGRGTGTARQIPSKVEIHGGPPVVPCGPVRLCWLQAPGRPTALGASAHLLPQGACQPHPTSVQTAHLLPICCFGGTSPQTCRPRDGFQGSMDRPLRLSPEAGLGLFPRLNPHPHPPGTGPPVDQAAEPSEPGGHIPPASC